MTLGVTNDENYNDIADALREVGVGMSDATFTPSQMAPAIRGLRSIWGNIEGQLANQSDLQNALNAKANSADLGDMAAEDDAPSDDKQYGRKNGDWVPITDELANWGQIGGTLSNQTDLQNALDSKADADSVYTKTETDTLLDEKADADSVYTKTETDTLLDEKADADSVYTKTETDTLLDEKVDASSVYTKTETNTLVTSEINAYHDDTKAPVITETASGSIASFTDGAPLPVEDLTVAIEPVQDLHGYDNPWPAGGGKNLFQTTMETQTVDNVTFKVNSDGSVTISGVASANVTNKNFGSKTLPAGTYKVNGFSGGTSNTGLRMAVYNDTSRQSITNIYLDRDIEFTLAEESVVRLYPIISTNNFDGNPITFYPMIRLASIADATFAPYENICPISGWTGTRIFKTRKNLLNPENWIATRVTVDENGVYTFTAGGYNADLYTGQNGSNHVIPSSYFDKLPYLPAGTYTWSFKYISGGAVRGVSKVDKNGNKSSLSSNYAIKGDYYEVHFTLTEPSMINIERLSSETPAVFSEPQLELGSQRTAYEPYVGDVLPISWETEAGTVYGGVLDVLTGMLTVTHGYADLGALSWSYRGDNYNAFYTYDIRYIKSNDVEDNYNILCSGYKCVYKTNWHLENKVITAWNSFAVGNIIVKDTSYGTDASAFKAGVSGVQLVYKLKTPITVQLSPSQLNTLLGENHIWADTGDVNVTYRADTKLFIQGQIAESQRATRSLIAGIETSNTATKNYSSGDLVIVGDQLLKFTANTASGSTITVGSNVVVTTVAEQLLFLASA